MSSILPFPSQFSSSAAPEQATPGTENPAQSSPSLDQLPFELLKSVYSSLDRQSRANFALTSKGFAHIAKSMIEAIEVRTAKDLIDALKAFKEYNYLKKITITLSGNGFTKGKMEPVKKELQQLMADLRNVKHLVLSERGHIDVDALAPLLNKVDEMDLSKCSGMTNDALNSLLSRLPKLKRLSLEGCRWLKGDGLKNLPGAMEDLDLSWGDGMTNDALNSLLSRLPKLKRLNLRGCGWPNGAGLENITETMEDLDLSGCEGMTNDALNSLLSRLPKLKRLSLGHCLWLKGDGLKNIPETVEYLDLSECEEMTNGELNSLLFRLPRLKRLSLGGCRWLKDDGLKNLSETVEYLYLDLWWRTGMTEEKIADLQSKRRNLIIKREQSLEDRTWWSSPIP